jgi:hypothetical protein
MPAGGVLGWYSLMYATHVCTVAMGVPREDKPEVRIFAASEHGQSTAVLKDSQTRIGPEVQEL